MDFLERQAERVAFKPPESKLATEREIVAVSKLLKEVGEAVGATCVFFG
jgi:hypothetical protein